MLDNGNRKIFMDKYNLQETDACFFAKRFHNRHAQHNYKDANEILKDHCYYDFFEEIQYLRHVKSGYYGSPLQVIDHNTRFYSPKYGCYILTAQPYDFSDNYDKIKSTLDYYGLSFTIKKDLTWHTTAGDCTLYCIGEYSYLMNIFGKVDSVAGLPF